jgi:glycosyltransferase involved in cell wall biosynthesis
VAETTRLNILITSPSLQAQKNVSGISSVTGFIISNNLSRNYTVFTIGRSDGEKRGIAYGLSLIKTAFQFAATVASKKHQLLHFNFAFSKASVLRDAPLLFFAKLVGKKTVVHMHGGEYLTQQSPPNWMKQLVKISIKKNAVVIVLSEVEKEKLQQLYGFKNVQVLPNSVEVNEAKHFIRVESVNAKPLNLLFIGRISSSKGIHHIYEGIRILKTENIAFNFFMAGAGPDEAEYVEKFTTLLGEQFVFKGVVTGNAKNNLFKQTDVFLLPSLFEGLPMSLLETMSFGLVPIVTNVGSIGYVVKDGYNGVMLGNNPATEIAAAIKLLTNNAVLTKKLATNAAQTVFENYDPSKYIQNLNSMYSKALAGKKSFTQKIH